MILSKNEPGSEIRPEKYVTLDVAYVQLALFFYRENETSWRVEGKGREKLQTQAGELQAESRKGEKTFLRIDTHIGVGAPIDKFPSSCHHHRITTHIFIIHICFSLDTRRQRRLLLSLSPRCGHFNQLIKGFKVNLMKWNFNFLQRVGIVRTSSW